ncbi:hypothetical protein MKX01_010632, partial [Papaver californicum]
GFEKMISEMYLGDIARRVLRMAQEWDMFGDLPSSLMVLILRHTVPIKPIFKICISKARFYF